MRFFKSQDYMPYFVKLLRENRQVLRQSRATPKQVRRARPGRHIDPA